MSEIVINDITIKRVSDFRYPGYDITSITVVTCKQIVKLGEFRDSYKRTYLCIANERKESR